MWHLCCNLTRYWSPLDRHCAGNGRHDIGWDDRRWNACAASSRLPGVREYYLGAVQRTIGIHGGFESDRHPELAEQDDYMQHMLANVRSFEAIHRSVKSGTSKPLKANAPSVLLRNNK
jgi:hypothetical protein